MSTCMVGRHTKQSGETLDYVVDFSPWFDGMDRKDQPLSHSAVAEAGLNILASGIVDRSIRVVVSGGTSGTTYRVTVKMTTTDGIIREADFQVKVLDI